VVAAVLDGKGTNVVEAKYDPKGSVMFNDSLEEKMKIALIQFLSRRVWLDTDKVSNIRT